MLLYLSKHSSFLTQTFYLLQLQHSEVLFQQWPRSDDGVTPSHMTQLFVQCDFPPLKGKEAPNPPLRGGLSHSVFPATAKTVPWFCRVKNKPLHPNSSTWKLWRESSDATETGCLVLGGKRWECFCWWLRSTECGAQVWREALHALGVRSSWAT